MVTGKIVVEMPGKETEIARVFRRWFKQRSAKDGLFFALWLSSRTLWQFALDSLPSRRRQRYGDIDYDWDHRVDTTGATVGWRDRLLGLLNSPYQPTEPALFREMLDLLDADLSQFTFVDIGSGKGRTLLMASDYPFRRIIGVELLPTLHRVAQENIAKYKSDSQKCFAIEAKCQDAGEFIFPAGPLVIYLFNPLPEAGLARLLGNLRQSVRGHSRPVWIIYHNPALEQVLAQAGWLNKFKGTHQFAIYNWMKSR